MTAGASSRDVKISCIDTHELKENPLLSNISQPRLLSFTLDGWSVLGGKVSVSLVDRVAVLVGRNGAGKSAILEGFAALASCAVGRRVEYNDAESIPKILEIEVLTPTDRRLHYRYELLPFPLSVEDLDESSMDTTDDGFRFLVNDCCKYLDGQQELLWTTETGFRNIVFEDGRSLVYALDGTNSLDRSRFPMAFTSPVEVQWVFDVLKGVQMIAKTPAIMRPISKRNQSWLKVSRKAINSGPFLADKLARKILRLTDKETKGELESICQRIGIGNTITLQKFTSNDKSIEEDEKYLVSVLLDGVNIGLLSDGTLQVLSILIEIIVSHRAATIIIEEPEMRIHPGMLAKLLNEIKAYTFEDNLLLSTHSPQVVAWTQPSHINLVYRHDQQILVRKLSTDETDRVSAYLCEEGDLGEWLYSGILDE
jgi:ABC-type cobalamin/Fe3+-siderophores transport system ATPase subunit